MDRRGERFGDRKGAQLDPPTSSVSHRVLGRTWASVRRTESLHAIGPIVCIDCMRTPPDLRPAAPASFRRKVAIPDTAWPSHLGRRKIHRHRTRDASQDNAHIYPGRWRVERRRRARSDPVARRFQWQNVLVTSLGARATPRPPAGPGTLPIGVTGVTDAIGLTAVPAAPCRAVPGRARGSRRDDPGGRDRGARGAAGAAAGGRPGGGAWPNHGLAGRVVPGRRRWAEAAGRAGDAFEDVVVAARFRRGRVGGCEPGHSCPREWSTVRWPSASADVRRWHSMALDGTRCQAISGDVTRRHSTSLDVGAPPTSPFCPAPGWAISRTGHGAEVDQGVAFDRSYVIVVTSFIHRMK
jgi:hypothetical protein